jgi:hypothetical protein
LINLPIGLAAWIIGSRVLTESKDSTPGPVPDLFGSILLAFAVGALALALTRARTWGWIALPTVSTVVISFILFGFFVSRAAKHPAPVVELTMLRVRSFALANLGGLFFSCAFGALILGSALFLSSVWRSTNWILGLELTPGPLFAALAAVPSGKLSARIGAKPVAVIGAVVFGTGCLWIFTSITDNPAYLKAFLPGAILNGIGIGMSLPSVSAAAFASLPAGRLSTGSGILNMSRQVGTVLGVAVLVATVGDGSGAAAIDDFRNGYLAMALISFASGIVCLALPGRALGQIRQAGA